MMDVKISPVLSILKKTEDQLHISSNHIRDESVGIIQFLWTGTQIRKIIYY